MPRVPRRLPVEADEATSGRFVLETVCLLFAAGDAAAALDLARAAGGAAGNNTAIKKKNAAQSSFCNGYIPSRRSLIGDGAPVLQ